MNAYRLCVHFQFCKKTLPKKSNVRRMLQARKEAQAHFEICVLPVDYSCPTVLKTNVRHHPVKLLSGRF